MEDALALDEREFCDGAQLVSARSLNRFRKDAGTDDRNRQRRAQTVRSRHL
jgi:hypothetical protein